jgi:hypothetical protein
MVKAAEITQGFWWAIKRRPLMLPTVVQVIDHDHGQGDPFLRIVYLVGTDECLCVGELLRDSWEFLEPIADVGTQRKLESDAGYISLLETALMHLDDDLAAERGLPPGETADFTIYRGKHAGAVVTVHRPKEPS